MRIINVKDVVGAIPIGAQGDDRQTRVIIPIPVGLEGYDFTIAHTPAGGSAYAVQAASIRNRAIHWTVTAADTAVIGTGSLAITFKYQDQTMGSVSYSTSVTDDVIDTAIHSSVPTVEVEGETPEIEGVPETRYVCGEVSTISIEAPETGTIDVVFTSGDTPTVVTLPEDVMMPEWYAIEANRVYEIMITDGAYGAVISWPAE